MFKKGKGRDRKSYYKVTCPALQSFKILDVIFSPDHEDGFSFEELEDCLVERYNRNAAANAELRKLILSGCVNLFKEDVDLLREVVVDIDWKGHTLQRMPRTRTTKTIMRRGLLTISQIA